MMCAVMNDLDICLLNAVFSPTRCLGACGHTVAIATLGVMR